MVKNSQIIHLNSSTLYHSYLLGLICLDYFGSTVFNGFAGSTFFILILLSEGLGYKTVALFEIFFFNTI